MKLIKASLVTELALPRRKWQERGHWKYGLRLVMKRMEGLDFS